MLWNNKPVKKIGKNRQIVVILKKLLYTKVMCWLKMNDLLTRRPANSVIFSTTQFFQTERWKNFELHISKISFFIYQNFDRIEQSFSLEIIFFLRKTFIYYANWQKFGTFSHFERNFRVHKLKNPNFIGEIDKFRFLPRLKHATFAVPHALHLLLYQPTFMKRRGAHQLDRAFGKFYLKQAGSGSIWRCSYSSKYEWENPSWKNFCSPYKMFGIIAFLFSEIYRLTR